MLLREMLDREYKRELFRLQQRFIEDLPFADVNIVHDYLRIQLSDDFSRHNLRYIKPAMGFPSNKGAPYASTHILYATGTFYDGENHDPQEHNWSAFNYDQIKRLLYSWKPSSWHDR
jgi:hypothetical protein